MYRVHADESHPLVIPPHFPSLSHSWTRWNFSAGDRDRRWRRPGCHTHTPPNPLLAPSAPWPPTSKYPPYPLPIPSFFSFQAICLPSLVECLAPVQFASLGSGGPRLVRQTSRHWPFHLKCSWPPCFTFSPMRCPTIIPDPFTPYEFPHLQFLMLLTARVPHNQRGA